MIPAEAVEAAAKAIYADGWDGAPYWESMADDNADKIHHRVIAQRALEAAAPYMLETGKGKGPIVVPVPRSAVTNLYRTRT